MTSFLMLDLDFGTMNFSRTVALKILVLQTDIFGTFFTYLSGCSIAFEFEI